MRELLSFVVVCVFVAGVAPVQAQIFGGQYGPADQLLRSNLNMVDRWMWYGNMYGYTRGGQFYGMYDRNGRRLSRPVKIAIAGAELGATIGYAKGGGKGALIGAGLGAAPGLLAWAFSRGDNDDEMVVELPDQIPPMPQTAQMPSGRENGWNQRLREQANAGNLLFGSRRGCLEQGMATLKNEGGNPIRVHQNGVPYAYLPPRRSECGDPLASYEAEVLTMVVNGNSGSAEFVRRKPEGRDGLVLVWR